jgi:hypothetical protein
MHRKSRVYKFQSAWTIMSVRFLKIIKLKKQYLQNPSQKIWVTEHLGATINEFKKDLHQWIKLLKDDNKYLLADCQTIMKNWKIHLWQILKAHDVYYVRQKQRHTVEPFIN